MRFINTQKLKPGDILASPIYDQTGHILLAQNAKITEYLKRRLEQEKIMGVYIYDDLSKDIDLYQSLPFDKQVEAAQAVQEFNYEKCMFIASEIAQLLHNTDIIYTNMSILSGYDTSTYMHSVNVATYSGTLGIMIGLSEDKVEDLITAALLHDIGKTRIAEEIIKKPDALTDEEYNEIKKHPKYGYDILKDLQTIPSIVRVSVLEHHENSDGSGYPTGLTDNDIYLFAKIIHICDVYDAMLSKRSYKKRTSPNDVIEFIMANSGVMFNPGLVKIFIENLIPYPEGTPVILSDGQRGVVKHNYKDAPMRPVIRLYDGNNLDLKTVLNVVITDIDDGLPDVDTK